MCYNKMYAHKTPQAGTIAISLCGHDEGTKYAIIAAVNPDFVLCADGRLKKLENPKTKRFKHLRVLGSDERLTLAIAEGKLADAIIINTLKNF